MWVQCFRKGRKTNLPQRFLIQSNFKFLSSRFEYTTLQFNLYLYPILPLISLEPHSSNYSEPHNARGWLLVYLWPPRRRLLEVATLLYPSTSTTLDFNTASVTIDRLIDHTLTQDDSRHYAMNIVAPPTE